MAGENGREADRLIERLREAPWSFDFFQLVRRLEAAWPDRPRLARSQRLADEVVRFAQEPSLAFAPCTVSAVDNVPEQETLRLYLNFFGLLGPNGPLPLHLTEYARDRERNHFDPTLARFLDLFNHRQAALFYRAWASAQKTVSYEREHDDRFSAWIASLIGLGMESLRGRDATPDEAKLFFAGHLICPTRHAQGLEALLASYFQMPARIDQFVGQWMDLPAEARCQLGKDPASGTLGVSAIAGSRIWECQQKFLVRFGPMGIEEYERMLPGGASQQRLAAWVRNYIGFELSCDVQLILRSREVPKTTLGGYGRLGWSTWLASKPFARDVDDLVLTRAA
jgi:type VI secretion system protein ImpH